ncbi:MULTISPECIES: DNA-directed RNA polymerase subunit omega [Campylobacter]|uniref:DNA-directed RNA polymerase subunit omega n=1 Tax=Campylobacter magnus TaxID=3026462 RepID=A0ABT8T4U1_9BACT|nr:MULTISPECIES: DNA-directed RNA polymerase subunit omega [Campylobacter]MDD7704484.1 DNA-directed RNA polymerase subunit omega [Campylobacteraceae bacterium]MCI7446710.1 DNA-directed RNA polymerase subunit omega [Campylobacter sp.]MDD0846680.1 DNA-directed RNA polymerase subunit omega [Campylobacter magnus]MDD0847683.1 DNA-directed RNA polymerase subunit omega [Campylobacter magnus]MDD0855140.1 DNA-directed RNA polymerase subunit omega [Campylobacter magnus]
MRSEQIITKALEKVGDDRYKLSLIVAKRAEQLGNGAEPLIDDTAKLKNVDIALREIAEGKISIDD